MPQFGFGTGNIYSMPVGGGSPLKFGALQDVSVDFSADIKNLHGQSQFPLAVARGKAKIEGKAASGQLDLDLYNALFFNETVATGQKIPVFQEAGAVPAASTYTVTVTNGATFSQDMGVTLVSTGVALKQVPSAPATGQYAVNSTTGVYTFNSAQASAAVLIDYVYTSASLGKTMNITNQLMGSAPTFQLVLAEKFQGKTLIMVLYSNTSSKLSFPFKQDDFLINEFDFQSQANDAGQIGYISLG